MSGDLRRSDGRSVVNPPVFVNTHVCTKMHENVAGRPRMRAEPSAILDDQCLTRMRLVQPPFEFLDATFRSFASRGLFRQPLLGGIDA